MQKNKKHNAATRENLLNAAERLFAEHGYDGVGMRALAAEAGVNLGAATYHFGSKERLYIETVMRCILPIREERIKLLRQAERTAEGKPVPLETIIDCMLRPPLMTILEHPHFSALLARNLFMPPPFMREFLARNANQAHEPFVLALTLALPGLPVEVLRVREMFARGTMLMFLSKISVPKSAEFCDFVLKEMVVCIAAGFRSASIMPDFTLPPLPTLPSF